MKVESMCRSSSDNGCFVDSCLRVIVGCRTLKVGWILLHLRRTVCNGQLSVHRVSWRSRRDRQTHSSWLAISHLHSVIC